MGSDAPARVAVITGASRGLGAGLARDFAQRGLLLGLCARSEPALEGSETVLSRRLDVRDGPEVDRFARDVLDRFGRIDLWVNNAGVLRPIAPLRACSSQDYQANLEINLSGVFHGSRAFANHVRERAGEGVLINVSSGAARKPYAGWSAYCAAKAGVDRMTECLALEEADAGLRAHAIAPGVLDTDMQTQIRAAAVADFPERPRFEAMKRDARFNSAAFVAAEFLAIAFDPARRNSEVCLRLDDEAGAS